jgi:hypothetical protein
MKGVATRARTLFFAPEDRHKSWQSRLLLKLYVAFRAWANLRGTKEAANIAE